MNVRLSAEALRALDLHRLNEIEQRISDLAVRHFKMQQELSRLLDERDALRLLVKS